MDVKNSFRTLCVLNIKHLSNTSQIVDININRIEYKYVGLTFSADNFT